MGRVTVSKTGQKTPSPREDATEVPVGRVAVPKSVQKPPSPRGAASEVLVGRVAVAKSGQKTALQRDNLYPMVPLHEARAGGPARYALRNSGTK